jgi:hypothetical protein
MVEQAELVGGDVLDLLNVGSAAFAAAAAFLATRITKIRSRRRGGSFAARRLPTGGGWSALIWNFVGSSLAGAVLTRLRGLSGLGAFSRSTHYR